VSKNIYIAGRGMNPSKESELQPGMPISNYIHLQSNICGPSESKALTEVGKGSTECDVGLRLNLEILFCGWENVHLDSLVWIVVFCCSSASMMRRGGEYLDFLTPDGLTWISQGQILLSAFFSLSSLWFWLSSGWNSALRVPLFCASSIYCLRGKASENGDPNQVQRRSFFTMNRVYLEHHL